MMMSMQQVLPMILYGRAGMLLLAVTNRLVLINSCYSLTCYSLAAEN
jgi:hypothetical protein